MTKTQLRPREGEFSSTKTMYIDVRTMVHIDV